MGSTASTAKFAKADQEPLPQAPPQAPPDAQKTESSATEGEKNEHNKRPAEEGTTEFDAKSIFGRLDTWFKEASASMEKVPGFNFDGEVAINLLVETFYNKIMDDDKLAFFFSGVSMDVLRRHQFEFLRSVLSTGSFKYNGKPMRIGHARLFEKGLNETHFDMVAGHLVNSLAELGVPQDIVDDIVQVVVPLRSIFEEEAQKVIARAAKRKKT